MDVNDKDGTLELTEEEYDKLLIDLESFEEKFYSTLADSKNYEIIPTMTEDGRFLSKEQLSLLVKECHRLGLRYLYKIDLNSSVTLLINPKTMKIAYINDEVH